MDENKPIDGVVCWVLYVLLILRVFALAGIGIYQSHLFATRGIDTPGYVIGKKGYVGRNGHPYLIYGYKIDDGMIFQFPGYVDTRNWQAWSVGTTIPIRYLVGAPGINRIVDVFENQDRNAGIFGALCLGMVGLIYGI